MIWEKDGVYLCTDCGFKSTDKKAVKRCEKAHKELERILHCTEFEITEQHLKLLQQQNVKFRRSGEYGGTEVDPKRPYGNSYVEGDILEHLGMTGDVDNGDGSFSCSKDLEQRLFHLHVETTVALQISMALQKFETGKFKREDWISGEWAKSKEDKNE